MSFEVQLVRAGAGSLETQTGLFVFAGPERNAAEAKWRVDRLI
jgi:hypothetical protein